MKPDIIIVCAEHDCYLGDMICQVNFGYHHGTSLDTYFRFKI